MRFVSTHIDGVQVVELDPIVDHRGFFARLWSRDEFLAAGVPYDWVQCNRGFSARAGTVRGIHYQTSPSEEAKLVWCSAGALFDVAVDLRPDSATRGEWFGLQLTPTNHMALLVPPGVGHGYQTTLPNTDLFYLTSHSHDPGAATGARWDDPTFGVEWPLPPGPISNQDKTWPLQGLNQ